MNSPDTIPRLLQDKIHSILSYMKRIDDKHRHYNIPRHKCKSQYGINDQLLLIAEDAGLNYHTQNKEKHYDQYDLYNLSLHLNLPSIQKIAIRSWSSILKKIIDKQSIKILIKYELSTKIDSSTSCRLLTPEGVLTKKTDNAILYQYQYTTKHNPVIIPNEIAELTNRISELSFFMLPDKLRWDLGFIKEHRMCECGGGSKLLLSLLIERDFLAKQCFGLLVAKPFSTAHYWVSCELDNYSIYLDPLLIKLLTVHGGVKNQLLSSAFPVNGILKNLAEVECFDENTGAPITSTYDKYYSKPIVTSHGQEIDAIFPTSILDNTH